MTRLERVGDRGRFPTDIRTRILESIVRTDAGCWEWTKTLNPLGYGRMAVGSRADGTRRLTTPHRASYEAFVGPIPDGADLDHLCRNKRCVNPAHLEPVTHSENLRRHYATVTTCPHGHAYDEANTYRDTSGKRRCRACMRERQRIRRSRLPR